MGLMSLSLVFLGACGSSDDGDTETGFTFSKKTSEVVLKVSGEAINSTSISFSWEIPADVDPKTDVIIEKKILNSSDSFSELTTATPKITVGNVVLNGLEPSTTYQIRARVRLGNDLSPYSAIVEKTTHDIGGSIWAKPNNLSAEPAPMKILLNWEYLDNTGLDGVSKIEIFRKQNPSGTPTVIETRTSAANIALTSYIDASVNFGVSYTYTVKATYSDQTPEVEAMSGAATPQKNATDLLAPNMIQGTEVYQNTGGGNFYLKSINLTWNYPSTPGLNGHNGFSFQVQLKNSPSGSFSNVGALQTAGSNLEAKNILTPNCQSANPSSVVRVQIRSTSTQGNSSVLVYSDEYQCLNI